MQSSLNYSVHLHALIETPDLPTPPARVDLDAKLALAGGGCIKTHLNPEVLASQSYLNQFQCA